MEVSIFFFFSFRDALLKMRDVYERNPQMGDVISLEPRLEEVKETLQRLEEELRKNQVLIPLIICTYTSTYTVLYIHKVHT